MSRPATLVLPVGPPGVGKSTLAERMVENGWLDWNAVVSPDLYRRVLTGDRACQEENEAVFHVTGLVAETRLRRGLTAYYDATNLGPLPVKSIAERGLSVVVILFPVPDDDWLVRHNLEREHPVPAEAVLRMADAARRLRPVDLPGEVVSPPEALEMAAAGRFL